MSLRTTVKVGSISNLSDARYCAGMEVDMLGFRVIEGQPQYVSREGFQGMRGWFSGPSIVAEVYGMSAAAVMPGILQYYLPDFIELSVKELPFIELPSVSLILQLTPNDFANQQVFLPYRNQIAYILMDDSCPEKLIHEVTGSFPVLIQLENKAIDQLLHLPIKGIALRGSEEEKPGLKNYEGLSTVLEKLEVTN